jgi:hypothetical protein
MAAYASQCPPIGQKSAAGIDLLLFTGYWRGSGRAERAEPVRAALEQGPARGESQHGRPQRYCDQRGREGIQRVAVLLRVPKNHIGI